MRVLPGPLLSGPKPDVVDTCTTFHVLLDVDHVGPEKEGILRCVPRDGLSDIQSWTEAEGKAEGRFA